MQSSRRAITDAARRLRLIAKLTAPPFSTEELLRAAWPSALVTGSDELPDGVDELIVLRPWGLIICYRRSLSPPQQRLAVAHAIGHLVFDFTVSALRTPIVQCTPFREDRANAFAAELLAPRELVRRFVAAPAGYGRVNRILFLDAVDRCASRLNITVETVFCQLDLMAPGEAGGGN